MGRGKPYKQIISNKKEKKTEILSVKTKQTKNNFIFIQQSYLSHNNREKGKTTNKKEGGASGANIDTFLNGQNTERKKISSIINKCKKTQQSSKFKTKQNKTESGKGKRG